MENVKHRILDVIPQNDLHFSPGVSKAEIQFVAPCWDSLAIMSQESDIEGSGADSWYLNLLINK
jgi:hypothetical protein